MIVFQSPLRLKTTERIYIMKFILTAITAGSMFTALGQVPLPSYTVYDLGALGTGTNSSGFGINKCGVGGRVFEPCARRPATLLPLLWKPHCEGSRHTGWRELPYLQQRSGWAER